jgi:hypothetical protein
MEVGKWWRGQGREEREDWKRRGCPCCVMVRGYRGLAVYFIRPRRPLTLPASLTLINVINNHHLNISTVKRGE